MYLLGRYSGVDVLIQSAVAPPRGPGFSASRVAHADTLEIWVTGPVEASDTTVWRLIHEGAVVAIVATDFL